MVLTIKQNIGRDTQVISMSMSSTEAYLSVFSMEEDPLSTKKRGVYHPLPQPTVQHAHCWQVQHFHYRQILLF